jgi:hypothetical protein
MANTYEVLLIPADRGLPMRRVVIDRSESLATLQGLVNGNIQALDVPGAARMTAYINEEGKFTCLDEHGKPLVNERATAVIGPLLDAGDFIAGDLVLSRFDPDKGENLDCPEGWEARIEVDGVTLPQRQLPEPESVERKDRQVRYYWRLREESAGARYAVLTISHRTAGTLSGKRHGNEFVAGLQTHTGTGCRSFALGSGLGIAVEPVARFSQTRFAEFEPRALNALKVLYGRSDHRVTRYFATDHGICLGAAA